MTSDLHHLSHRGLTQILIPKWLQSPDCDLDGCIESSAYGESPNQLLSKIFAKLELTPNDIFLDLGAGAGSVVGEAKSLVGQSIGIEWNPELVGHAKQFLADNSDCSIHCDNFLTAHWFQATKIYAATARFSQSTRQGVADRLNQESQVQSVACLGLPLPLSDDWSLNWESKESVVWNEGEQALSESLFIWERV